MLRKQTDELDPADWFAFATERLKTSDVVWASEGLTASGIELLQESVERLLKGYLIASGWSLVKTHDLMTLIEEAAKFDARFTVHRRVAAELTADFFAQHYPGHDMTNVGLNYENWRIAVGELFSLVASLLPKYAKDLNK